MSIASTGEIRYFPLFFKNDLKKILVGDNPKPQNLHFLRALKGSFFSAKKNELSSLLMRAKLISVYSMAAERQRVNRYLQKKETHLKKIYGNSYIKIYMQRRRKQKNPVRK